MTDEVRGPSRITGPIDLTDVGPENREQAMNYLQGQLCETCNELVVVAGRVSSTASAFYLLSNLLAGEPVSGANNELSQALHVLADRQFIQTAGIEYLSSEYVSALRSLKPIVDEANFVCDALEKLQEAEDVNPVVEQTDNAIMDKIQSSLEKAKAEEPPPVEVKK